MTKQRGLGLARPHTRRVPLDQEPERAADASPEYRTWIDMLRRCTNKDCIDYEEYGGRGVKVSERWLSFENFLADMGRKPSRAHSIDRIDPDGDYHPGNCRWATPTQQRTNRRDSVQQ